MKKWTVKKRDGAWVAVDRGGYLRYASDDFERTLAFALIAYEDDRMMTMLSPIRPDEMPPWFWKGL